MGGSRPQSPFAEKFPPALFYLLLLLGLSAWYLASWPIEALDTDLWYHLSGGRYILTRHAIPTTSFFSFIEPPRQWLDYYWLFQVWVFWLHSAGGYVLLIAFRVVLYAAILAAILWLLLGGRKRGEPVSWSVFLAVCAALILLPRCFVVRPHLFTYAFLALSLGILQRKPKLAWLMPLVGVLWCNLHGVTYPILWLVCGAYLLEAFFARGRVAPGKAVPIAPLLLSLFAPLATPHGLRLLPVAFIPTADASRYIQELIPMSLEEVLSLHIHFMAPAHHSVVVILLLVALMSAATACLRRQMRISHALLLLGGFFLLFRGYRFANEFALLSLPLLAAHPIVGRPGILQEFPKPVYLIGLVLLLLMPLRMVAGHFDNKPAFPLSHRKLPRGVTAFLLKVDAGGRVLNFPDSGGWLQWRLYPRYKIFMDMEVPFLFTDADMRLMRDAFSQESALGHLLEQYRPDFITVPIQFDRFAALIGKHPDYVPVFFDDEEVLFADSARHPQLARDYRLQTLEPFQITDHSPQEIFEGDGRQLAGKDRLKAMQELRRLLEVDPDGGLTNHLAAWVYQDEGRYDQALAHAASIVAGFPDVAVGWRLRGDALAALGSHRLALSAYEAAIEQADAASRPLLYRKTGQIYLAEGKAARAYTVLRQNTSLYAAGIPAEDVYNVGAAALRAGDRAKAKELLEYVVRYRLGEKDGKWLNRLNEDLQSLGLAPAALAGDSAEAATKGK